MRSRAAWQCRSGPGLRGSRIHVLLRHRLLRESHGFEGLRASLVAESGLNDLAVPELKDIGNSEVRRRSFSALAVVIGDAHNMASFIDPEVIVLAGAVAEGRDLLLEPVRQECARRLPPGLVEKFRFEISNFGEDSVAIGAARLAMLPAS